MSYDSNEAPGTIIIDPSNHYLYRIEGDGNATRYGANVSRPEFLWSGDAYVGRKAEWPVWTPPKEMIARQPEAAKYAGGMPGGLDNPLGARTLYLYQDGSPSTRSTAPAIPTRSGPALQAAVPASSVRTCSTSIHVRPSRRRWSCCRHRRRRRPGRRGPPRKARWRSRCPAAGRPDRRGDAAGRPALAAAVKSDAG